MTFCNSVWSLENLPVAKMTSSVVDNMPAEPVVIVRELNGEGTMANGKVRLSPKAKPGDYGNMLKKYSII